MEEHGDPGTRNEAGGQIAERAGAYGDLSPIDGMVHGGIILDPESTWVERIPNVVMSIES
jgi:hypothetical protein